MNASELEKLLVAYGYDDEALATVRRWLADGKEVLVYRNEDMGHPALGHVLACVLNAELIALGNGEPPKFWPYNNTGGNGPGWRYVLRDRVSA